MIVCRSFEEALRKDWTKQSLKMPYESSRITIDKDGSLCILLQNTGSQLIKYTSSQNHAVNFAGTIHI